MSHTSPRRVAEPPARANRCGPSYGPHEASQLDARHQNLMDILVALIDRIRRNPKTNDDRQDSLSEPLRLIARAEQLLHAHFAFDEAGGYLSDTLAVAPRLSVRAARLECDHRKFAARFAKLATFARSLREMDEGWDYLGVAVREFARELKLHKLEENHLVQEAFLDDFGGA